MSSPAAGASIWRVGSARDLRAGELLWRRKLRRVLQLHFGAALELGDALLVNPYDVQQVAGAILRALEMPAEEQAMRMQHMRNNVRENNVYRWAANLLSDLTDIRIDTPERIEVQ